MFLGTFKTYFTGKNRIVLPKKFRREPGVEDKFYLIMGQDGEIWGLDIKQWQKEAENRLELPLTEEEGRKQRRKFFPRAEECFLDHQGRFILPSEFVNFAEIETEVLIIGAGDHFEIWNPKKWTEKMAETL